MFSRILYLNDYQRTMAQIMFDYGAPINTISFLECVNKYKKSINLFDCVNIVVKIINKPIYFMNTVTQHSPRYDCYILNATLGEMLSVIKQHPNENLTNELSLIISNTFPVSFYSDIFTTAKHGSSGLYDEQTYTSKIEDIFFYDAPGLVDNFARDIVYADDMVRINMRLHIPYFIVSELEKMNAKIIYKKPLMIGDKLVMAKPRNGNYKELEIKQTADSILYREINSDDFLSMNTVYEVVCNLKLSEIKKLVLNCVDRDALLDKPVIAYLYYLLIPYVYIYSNIKVPNDNKVIDPLYH